MARYGADFETWARECVRIVDKESGREVPFVLNAPQRRVLGIMERQRRERRPVRVIMLKARQWGGSTLVQIYMAWLQLVVCRGWNSLTCAHVKDAASAIRGMYARLLRSYPEEMKPGAAKDWTLAPYEKSATTGYVAARDCQVAIATSMSPNSVRGSNFAMAHLSEVAFWADGDVRDAEEIVRTVSGTVLRVPDSVVVMESTANGMENYFYREWKRAEAGESDKVAVFVPWHEIELYRREVSPAEIGRLVASLDEYERDLLGSGVPLEAVAWYHDKRREYQTHEAMMAEFPSTAEEAFRTSVRPVFAPDTLPEPRDSEAAPNVGVFVPGGDGTADHLSLLFVGDERLVGVEEVEYPCGDGESVGSAAGRCASLGVAMLIAEGGDAVRSHLAWCSRIASRSGVRLLYDGDDNPWLRLDGDLLSEAVDRLSALLRDGCVSESSEEECRAYGSFRLDTPSRHPAVLARLAAVLHSDTLRTADDFASLL